jgi:hypothetical protein
VYFPVPPFQPLSPIPPMIYTLRDPISRGSHMTHVGWPGWLHSNNMHVIERYTRSGNTLTWQATVEDPDVLLAPFVAQPRTLRLNPNLKATLIEDLPCEERDSQHIVTHERG